MMKAFTLREIAALTSAKIVGNPEHLISGVENLETASSQHIAFLDNPLYTKQLTASNAGAVFVNLSFTASDHKNYLLVPSPSLAFQSVIELFQKRPSSGFVGIHPTAVVHPEATLEAGVSIGPYAVVDRDVYIGAGTTLGAHVSIGPSVRIGANCTLHSHAIVREGCMIGNRVVLQPGAVIGSCGFGYFTTPEGKHRPLDQLGIVILEDDVEVGANTTIDRARFKSTRIGSGTKIDNLVQIGHQVELGRDNLIVSQAGIAGSTKTGRLVIMGGQVGVAGHITISDHVMLAARAAVSKSLLEPGTYSGAPAAPIKEFNHQFVQIRSLPKWIQRIKELEAKLKELESCCSPKADTLN